MRKSIGIFFGILLLCIAICRAQVPVSQTVYMVPGGAVTLTANPVNAPKYQWIKDGVPIANATTVNYIANSPGVYTVISYNIAGCASDLSDPVNILIHPSSRAADVTIALESEDSTTAPGEVFDYLLRISNNGPDIASSILVSALLSDKVGLETLISPLVGVANYDPKTNIVTWQLSKLAVGEIADLKIRVKGKNGGTAKNSASISATEKDPKLSNNIAIHIKSIIEIRVPNVFTPNNDGKNDQFIISGLENYTANEIKIINRWGSSVYEKKNYTNDWIANGLSDGTYFYVIRVRTATSEWQEIKGYITVIR